MLQEVLGALAGADWSRFRSYAKRVRSLQYADSDEYYKDRTPLEMGVDVIGVISLHHPFGQSFLPHIRDLHWCTSHPVIEMIPFLSKELIHLDLHLYNLSEARLAETFNILRNLTLKLKAFRLDTPAVGLNSEASLVLWLETMETLEKIELPPYYLTGRLLATIKAFPRLQIIDQTVDFRNVYNDSDILEAPPENSFPSLVQLVLPATPAAAQRFLFSSHTIFNRLTLLVLSATRNIEASQLLAFTQHLASHCPMIANISLILSLSPAFRSQGATALPIEILENLYPCKILTAFTIAHPLPLKFNSTDVENMGRAWPRMLDLHLCSKPDFFFTIPEHMGADLSILSTFALHLPNLQNLGLYLNGRDQITFAGQLNPECQFTQLETLHVGLSPIPQSKIYDLSFYLASLCSQNVGVYYTFGACGGLKPMDHVKRGAAWAEVHDMVSFAMRVKLKMQT